MPDDERPRIFPEGIFTATGVHSNDLFETLPLPEVGVPTLEMKFRFSGCSFMKIATIIEVIATMTIRRIRHEGERKN